MKRYEREKKFILHLDGFFFLIKKKTQQKLVFELREIKRRRRREGMLSTQERDFKYAMAMNLKVKSC